MTAVLVTGGAGFAGGHLLEHLAGRGPLVAWSRSSPPAALAHLARWQQVDVLDAAQVESAIAGIKPSAIFHLAGLPHVAESWTDTARPLAVNVLGTHHVLEAIRKTGTTCRILVAGSAHVYAASEGPIREDHPLVPGSPYGLSKLAQDQLALRAAAEDGLDVVVARAFNHTGPRQLPSFVAPSIARQLARIERGEDEPELRVGNLDTSRDLLDVRDVVRAYAILMARGTSGRAYNVASGAARPIRDVLDALAGRARVPVRIETDPARLRPHDMPVLVGDATRLRTETGWQPVISFEQTMDDLLDYWRSRM